MIVIKKLDHTLRRRVCLGGNGMGRGIPLPVDWDVMEERGLAENGNDFDAFHVQKTLFTGRMPFLPHNQQCQSTEGTQYRKVFCGRGSLKCRKITDEVGLWTVNCQKISLPRAYIASTLMVVSQLPAQCSRTFSHDYPGSSEQYRLFRRLLKTYFFARY